MSLTRDDDGVSACARRRPLSRGQVLVALRRDHRVVVVTRQAGDAGGLFGVQQHHERIVLRVHRARGAHGAPAADQGDDLQATLGHVLGAVAQHGEAREHPEEVGRVPSIHTHLFAQLEAYVR